jgi:hypothetical protein
MHAIPWRSALVATAAAAFVAASGARAEDPVIPPANPAEISAGQLAEHPATYLGKRVAVRAQVEEIHSPRFFTLDENRVGVSPDVLVLSPTGEMPRDGSTVIVTGTVRRFVREELQRDYDWFTLETKYDETYKERPVIIADSVQTVKD